MPLSPEKKTAYIAKLQELMGTYNKMLLVSADNVGSNQMQKIRMALRGSAEVLMGKNTMMKYAMNQFLRSNPGHAYAKVMPYVCGNVGFVFTNGDLNVVRKTLMENVEPAPARVGAIAPVDVWVPAGPTGADPGQTAFFQALNIATKISRGQIEIVSDVHLIQAGEKVEPGQAALLKKLEMRPFTYGLGLTVVYDNGSLFDPKVLDLADEDLIRFFMNGAGYVAALSTALGVPTLANLRFMVANTFTTLLAVALATEYTFEEAQIYKDYLADPSKFAAAIAAAGAGGGDGGAKEEAAPAEAEEEEEADVGAGGLFGGDDAY